MTILKLFLLSCLVVGSSRAFVLVTGSVRVTPGGADAVTQLPRCTSSSLQALPPPFTTLSTTPALLESSSTTFLQASTTTVDPTALLSNTVGNLIGSPAILAVPIVAALGLATLLAWLIASYAEPQVQDDEE